MAKNYDILAKEIIENIGGKENIAHLEHCSTRLRFTIKNNADINESNIRDIDGVLEVVNGAQLQIIIGNDVVEAYDAVINIVGEISGEESPKSTEKKSIMSTILDYLIGIFAPLVPAIAGGGVLKSILLLLVALGLMSDTSNTYLVLTMVGDAPLYFLPLLVSLSTANKLKVNPYVAIAISGALLLPNMTTFLNGEDPTLFGIGVQNIQYSYQVLPAILAIFLYAPLEKYITKYTPKPIRIFFVPLLCMLIVVPITLFILGPLGYTIGEVISNIIVNIYDSVGFIAVGLLAAILPFMIFAGMHKALIPYALNSVSTLGYEPLYLPASLAHNLSESGACFAVALRTKNSTLRATAISAGISALFGITEPALYGVTFQNKRVLSAVCLSSAIGGLFAGIFMLKAFVLVGPGIASITMFVDPSNAMNLVYAFIVLAISFVASFVICIIFYKKEEV